MRSPTVCICSTLLIGMAMPKWSSTSIMSSTASSPMGQSRNVRNKRRKLTCMHPLPSEFMVTVINGQINIGRDAMACKYSERFVFKTTVRMTRWLVMGMALAARNCGVARTLSCFSGHDKHIRMWLALG